MNEEYVPSRIAAKALGLHPDTLRSMDKKGLIQTIRTPGNKRLYNLKRYIQDNCSQFPVLHTSEKISVCYCRVSSRNQKDDLQRQITFMQTKYPTHQIIKDIGSGLNFKRKGLKTILELAHRGELQELVVAHKDRLSRFGFDLIEHILFSQSNARIVVLNNTKLSPEQEVTQDLLHIIHVFSSRCYGLRKYYNQVQKDSTLSDCYSETSS